MRNLLFNAINNEPSTYWSGADANHLSVTERDGRIRFRMIFRKRISGPDLWITLNGSFGLRVEDGRLVPVGETFSGDAEFPKWWGFLTGFLGGLALAVNEANEKARKQAGEFVQVLVDFLNVLMVPSAGKAPRTVHVQTRNGLPIITFFECDSAELTVFAHALAAGVVRAVDSVGADVADVS